MKLISGALPPSAGDRVASPDLIVGNFAQLEVDRLDARDTALIALTDRIDEIGVRGQWDEQRRRNHLGGFGFRGDRVFEPVVHFSGGERARLALAILVAERPNLLLLDEPTNHLDFEMRHSLITALQEFAGAVIVVSHDRGLLRSVCDQFWLVADGAVRDFDGDLEDYAGWLEKRSTTASTPVAPEARNGGQPQARDGGQPQARMADSQSAREPAPQGCRDAPRPRPEAPGDQVHRELRCRNWARSARGSNPTSPRSTTARSGARAQGHRTTRGRAGRDRATGDTLARTIRAVRILTMADEPDATPIDPSPPPAERRRNWHIRSVVMYGFLTLWALVALWNLYKPLPDGTSVRGEVIDYRSTSSSSCRRDQRGRVRRADSSTASLRRDAGHHWRGAPVHRRRLLPVQRAARRDQRLAGAPCLVRRAARCVAGSASARCRASWSWSSMIPSTTCTAAASVRRYGRAAHRRHRGGGDIDLDELRDSNFIYSAFWRLTMKWWSGDGSGDGWLPNPLDEGPEEVTSAPGRGCSTSRPITARC